MWIENAKIYICLKLLISWWLQQPMWRKQNKVNFVLVLYHQTIEQLLPSGCKTPETSCSETDNLLTDDLFCHIQPSVFLKKILKKKKKTPLNCHLTVVEGLSTWMILGAMLRAYWHTGSVSGLPAAQWCKRKCCRGSLRWPRKSSAAIWHQWRNFMASAASGKPWPSLRTHHTPDTICSKYFHQTDNTGSSKLAQTDSKAVSTKQLWLH